MESEETAILREHLKIFNMPQGNLKKEFIPGVDLLGENDCVNKETKNFKIPQGALKNPYHIHHEEFEHIEVSMIEIFDKVSFKTKGKKQYSILLTDGKRYVCIYGKEYVESAIAAGDNTIRCLVKHVDALSDQLITVKVTGTRIKSEGDPVTYPEILKAFNVIIKEYDADGVDTSHVEHGGARRGEAFKLLKEDDFIDQVLVDELGKSRKTILNYKSDSVCIAEGLFDYLIEKKAGKEFFEKIRHNKNEALMSIEEETKDEDFDLTEYITNIISDNIRKAFIENKPKKPAPDFILLTRAETDYIKDEVKLITSQIEKEIEEENEKKKLDSLTSGEDKREEVKFPTFENNEHSNSDVSEKELLIAEVKKVYEELGKLITNTSVANFKDEALSICASYLSYSLLHNCLG